MMAQPYFKASAPGSLMLFGEYAVLEGHLAIVAATQQKIHATLTPHAEPTIVIESAQLGRQVIPLNAFQIQKPFDFVLRAIAEFFPITHGFTITFEAEFSDDIGFGSSAAVVCLTLTLLLTWLKKEPINKEVLFQLGKQVIVKQQGRGSGADLAASIYGGIIAFRSTPFHVELLSARDFDLNAYYIGYKTPTAIAISLYRQKRAKAPERVKKIIQAIVAVTEQAKTAFLQEDIQMIAHCMTKQQQCMIDLGVNDPCIDQIIALLAEVGLEAKISGSGLGDCVIALKKVLSQSFAERLTAIHPAARLLPVTVGGKGLCINA